MLTRFVRIQLTVFTILSIIGILSMVLVYVQAPTLLGIGRITVRLELPSGGGIYRFSNVTYRGVQVGKVTAVDVLSNHVEVTLSLDTSPRIPTDLRAEVRSVSAVGEQYVDLRPRAEVAPYLKDGSVIPLEKTSIPQPVGPMLDRVSALINSIPKDKLGALLDESFKGLNGAGYDLGSLLDSSAQVAGDLKPVADPTRALVDNAVPLLDSQANTTDSIRTWVHSLAGVTRTAVADDRQLRTLLRSGPGAVNEVSRLLDQIKPTLPVLLANLTTVGQVLVTYNPSLEQLLVLLPPAIAALQSAGLSANNATGQAMGEFAISIGDPPPCTVGFLPPSSWRSPADTTTIDTPDGLYCKLPQDAPISVRGARNYPCMGNPGKRAPTVQICDSDKPYEPLAMRQHVLGPYPLDPNLLSQGIPPDGRVTADEHTFGPVEGTPLPPGASPSGTPPAGAAPSSLTTAGPKPLVGFAGYDPRTGKYMTPDGQLFRQSNVISDAAPKSWKDMLPT
ncbi:MCE family protein [Mycobacterium sp. SP-6446]|uniref:MCE family protein n=1 Tax=Mycobacterium sp. SP-6446 TaxID=1834162 RepID=UPI00096DD747|nr:MlaD family protein [Mycobacterium sp. SP-6446]OMC15740.1 virulence factor Mce [Mycobacterium sp. SP-6446]